MSGGVDSSVAAALLKERGWFVVGVFMKFWSEPVCAGKKRAVNRCCSGDAYEAAKSVCAKLDIPFRALDVQKEFKKEVVNYFLREYRTGRTPNPCVRCNEEIKFKLLLKTAKKWGMDYAATGHYARLQKVKSQNSKVVFKLLTAKDKEKDQSYFLYTLTQSQLGRILFPLGDYTKSEARLMAKKRKLATAERPESFEICFVPDKKTVDFLARHIKAKPGKIVDEKGRKIGGHRGLPFYTIGQRHGLGAVKGAGPFYVAAKNTAKNELVAINNPRSPLLSRKELVAEKVNWIPGISPKFPLKCETKIRYRHKAEQAEIIKSQKHAPYRNEVSGAGSKVKNQKYNSKFKSDDYLVRFKKPQRAVTPGQSVVFYSGREVLGGGVIV